MKLLARRALFLLAWSPLVMLATDCTSQVEGERCDKQNLDADCETGLFCKTGLYIGGYVHSICCPIPPATATVGACNASGVPPIDAGVSPDGSASDAPTDSGGESSIRTDAVSEASDDRTTTDARDVSADLSTDMSTRDAPGEGAAPDTQDAPDDTSAPDGAAPDSNDDDTSEDAPAPEPAPDAPDDRNDGAASDGLTPIDIQDSADAPTADGPG